MQESHTGEATCRPNIKNHFCTTPFMSAVVTANGDGLTSCDSGLLLLLIPWIVSLVFVLILLLVVTAVIPVLYARKRKHLMENSSSNVEVESDSQMTINVSRVITRSCISPFTKPTNKFTSFLVISQASTDNTSFRQTGSTAEFYISPIISCIGDLDIMVYKRNTLVVESGNPKFPEVIEQYEATVNVLKMEPISKYPGFVRLLYVGDFRKSLESEEYQFLELTNHDQKYAKTFSYVTEENPISEDKVSGPALTRAIKGKLPGEISGILEDLVGSCLCCSWPSVAADWRLRKRPHGWPSEVLIQNVVAGSCDVVQVSHPKCRDDKYMFRLSFSRAEIMLIRSWSHVQQVVYHMLRFFSKEELVNPKWERKNKILCTYHIKTVILWSCETRGKDFWEQHVIDICCKLLKILLDSLEQRRLPNYFVPESNLLDHIQNKTNRQEVMDKLKRFKCRNVLGRWFLHNYVQKSRVLNDLYTAECAASVLDEDTIKEIFANAFKGLNYCHKEKEKENRFCSLVYVFGPIRQYAVDRPYQVFISRRRAAVVGYWFVEYVTAIQLLRLVNDMCSFMFDEWEVKALDCFAKLYKQWEVHKFPSTYSKEILRPGRRYFITAQELMTGLDGRNLPHETQLLTSLSIHCLHKSMVVEDSITDLPSKQILLVYIAALHYKRKEYSIVIDLCSKILNNVSWRRRRVRKYVNGRLLQFIDEVANIRGFLALFRYGRNISNKPAAEAVYLGDSSFTPEVLAQHLLNLCRPHNWKVLLQERRGTSPTFADQCVIALTKYRIKLSDVKMNGTASGETFDPSPNLETTEQHNEIKKWCFINEKDLNSSFENELFPLLKDVYFEKLTLVYDIFRADLDMGYFADVLLIAFFLFRSETYDAKLQWRDSLERSKKIPWEKEDPSVMCFSIFLISMGREVDKIIDDEFLSVVGLGRLLQQISGLSPFPVNRSRNDAPPSSEGCKIGSTTESYSEIFSENPTLVYFLFKYLRLNCLMDAKPPKLALISAYRNMKYEVKMESEFKKFPSTGHIILPLARYKIKNILRGGHQ